MSSPVASGNVLLARRWLTQLCKASWTISGCWHFATSPGQFLTAMRPKRTLSGAAQGEPHSARRRGQGGADGERKAEKTPALYGRGQGGANPSGVTEPGPHLLVAREGDSVRRLPGSEVLLLRSRHPPGLAAAVASQRAHPTSDGVFFCNPLFHKQIMDRGGDRSAYG
jgi:hypothetical protein